MPDSKKHNRWFFGSAVCVLGAWIALIVGTVTIAPLYKNQSSSMPGDQAALGHAGAGLAGPLANLLVKRFRNAPTFTHLRLSQSTHRGLFTGRGEPNARVVLLRAGRALADARANENGEWQIATAIAKITGRHNFALEQRGADGIYVAGESIQLHVPAAFRQTINVTNSGPKAGFQLVAARTDREDIGSASSRKFDELMRNGRIEQSGDARQSFVAELSDDILAPAWSWLRDANRSYHGEVVPRIKRGGGYDQGGDGNRERDTASRTTNERDRWSNGRDRRLASDGRGNVTTRSGDGGSWVATGITDWLAAAQRGYSTEVVPRLSGRVPSVITARVRDEDPVQETAAERQRRLDLERDLERSATDKAEQERLNAARQRREAELRRKEAEEEARRLAEERQQSDLEEARKLAQERRRVLARRAEEKRLALAAERRREAETEAQRRSARVRQLDREQDEAEKEALERQRRAEQEQENKAAEDAERERKRQAQLNLQARENEREAAEQRRLEKERRDRLIAEAAAIKRRQAEARLRTRQENFRREKRLREERRLEARRLEARRLEERRLEERRQRIARSEARDRAAALARAAARERQESAQRRNQDSQPALPSQRPQRIAQQRLRDLNRFNRRDTEIEINVKPRSSDRPRSTAGSDGRTRVEAKPKRRITSSRRSKQTRKARRRRAVLAYRRRIAKAGGRRGRCHRTAGRRIDPPGTYTVKRGDSLWRISKRHYRLGRYFRMIHRANKRKIRRARLIYPCQRFHLPRRRRS